jgi:hypothetical protein
MCSFELMIGLPGFWSFSDFSLSLCPAWAQFTYPDAVIYLYPGDNSLLALHITVQRTGIPGAAWAAPDASSKSVVLAYGPASPVNTSLELALRSRT